MLRLAVLALVSFPALVLLASAPQRSTIASSSSNRTARSFTSAAGGPELFCQVRDALLVAPGEPERSILYHRLSRRGAGQMPPLASTVVDEKASRLLAEWIRRMK
jgi:hypothetical protein